MEEHDVSLFWLPLSDMPQPLDVPWACGTFKKPVSSIGSAGSLVNNCQFQTDWTFSKRFSSRSSIYLVRKVRIFVTCHRVKDEKSDLGPDRVKSEKFGKSERSEFSSWPLRNHAGGHWLPSPD